MAEVQQDNNNSSGIKLFGATISVKEGSSNSQQKNDHDQEPNPTVEKRPDKIIPCPRCKSMETKFCYFNNYNVNQPRHFCKGCHRYWTAGGALRNVPVGAGRRKNKPPCGEVSDGFGVDLEVMESGGFKQVFPVKRRRCVSNSQNDPPLCLVVSREKNN